MSIEQLGSKADHLSEELIQRVKRLSSSLISDGMGCTVSMDYTIKPVAPANKIVVGTALTVSVGPGDNVCLHKAVPLGEKGYILVVDGKGDTKNALLGELIATAAKKAGYEGIIVDGLARDQGALRRLDFPVYCKGFIPNGPLKGESGQINTAILCGGVSVRPGDLIVGDDDGVVVIPRENAEEIIRKAEMKAEYEEKRRQEIQNGQMLPAWLREGSKRESTT
ncbi:RraA family protein [Psychrobacillus vulpis]|uniref:Putative 4-hydroxy-4-methyl-2-oxoglutarate aldolase n=1 Tax=Psychrobacillus vulpis TaxID=2325572 RepID=A0A544TLT6_9BACI|nr:RraA family protein [Psychrobacillus vulpis]TQR18431.1 RraA family protein [Psychrobacillus vulpis]